MESESIFQILAAILGGGAIATLIGAWFNRRKTSAEAEKTAAEANATNTDTIFETGMKFHQLVSEEVEKQIRSREKSWIQERERAIKAETERWQDRLEKERKEWAKEKSELMSMIEKLKKRNKELEDIIQKKHLK